MPNDYVVLTSFTHHPYYQKFVIEIPDNWAWEGVHNIPLNELQETMLYAINNGFTFAWGADVSEKGFMFKEGLAVVPEKSFDTMTEMEKALLAIKPHKQLTITAELR